MSKKRLVITLEYPGGLTFEDLHIRHILSNTIEDRNLGEIVDEGGGEKFMDICIEMEESENSNQEIKSILEALGLDFRAKIEIEELDEE